MFHVGKFETWKVVDGISERTQRTQVRFSGAILFSLNLLFNAVPTFCETNFNSYLMNRVEVRLPVRLTRVIFPIRVSCLPPRT